MEKLVVHGMLVSLNEAIASAKTHWSAYASIKKRLTNQVCTLAMAQRIEPFDTPVVIRMTLYPHNRKTDPDNLLINSKWVLDGLVAAGVLADDGPKQIAGLEFKFDVERVNPRVVVEIEEADEPS